MPGLRVLLSTPSSRVDSAPMSAIAPSAWIKSAALHGALVGIMVVIAYTSALNVEKAPTIIELVAGPGDDYGAKEAPAEGTAAGVDFSIPKPGLVTPPAPTPEAAPTPTPPRPEPKQEPRPETKKEAAPPVPVQKEEPAPNFVKDIKRQAAAAKQKALREVAKERKKEEELRKKQAAEQKKKEAQMSKAEFDKLNANKKVASATTKPGATPFKKIDPKGITGGVAGGSSASKAGAGGKALVREDGAVMDVYYSILVQKLREEYEKQKPPGLSDSLEVTIELRSNANGTLSNIRVAQSSGSPEFDRAVLTAVREVRMPARPDGKSETITFAYSMKE